MTTPDIVLYVSYAIGVFILGFGFGFYTVALKKAIDQI